jgi:hypothetical protein
MISLLDSRRVVHGVDFSGARDAGKKIWIARGIIQQDVLLITECFKAKDLPDSGRDREQSLKALREFISKQKDSIFGLDFPFGIPKSLVKEESWKKFVSSFEDIYTTPEKFRRLCKSLSEGKELKRFTDIEAKTPFSPYNLRLYKQTYFGIRNVLGPLIRNDKIWALPMQKPLPERAWVLEICPATTLRRENLSLPYKGRGEIKRTARVKILEGIKKAEVLNIKKSALRSKILEDRGGDALDSVVAAFATFRALRNELPFDRNSPYALEGWVFA